MSGPPIITLPDLYREIRDIQATVTKIAVRIEGLPDHEKRIRALEKWRYAASGGLILAITSLISTLATHR